MLSITKFRMKPSTIKDGAIAKLGRNQVRSLILVNILLYPVLSQANFFKQAEKFVKGAGKAFDGLAKDTGKKIERSGMKIESNSKIIIKDGERVVKGVVKSAKAPLRTAGDIASGGQTVREREKLKADAENERAKIRRAQAEEMRKVAIQKSKENTANFEVELENVKNDLVLLKSISKQYSSLDENLEHMTLITLNLETSMRSFIANVNSEHLTLIKQIEKLIHTTQHAFDGDTPDQKINFSEEIRQIISDIKTFEDSDVYLGENYSTLEDTFYEKITILFKELDVALQESFVRLEQAILVKTERKKELESSLKNEKQILTKLSGGK